MSIIRDSFFMDNNFKRSKIFITNMYNKIYTVKAVQIIIRNDVSIMEYNSSN